MRPLDAVHEIARGLEAAGVPSPRVDAEHLVADVLELTRTQLYSADGELTEEQVRRLRNVEERRRRREPLAYILGEWGFRRLTLSVDRRVLIPRPETEILVERCLARLEDVAEPRVLDLGAGSGAIALALADEHRGARVLAVDRSEGAVAVARQNLERTGLGERVEFVRGELLRGLSGPFDLVVSNPPYVPPEEYETLQPEIRLYEPYEAVVGVGVGETIARDARAVLQPGGWLVLECGDGQAESLAAELGALGYADVLVSPDLAGRDRIVEGRCPWRPCRGQARTGPKPSAHARAYAA